MDDSDDIRVLAGQRLMLGFDGTQFNSDLAYIIGTLKAGGIILFSRNVDHPGQVKTLCRDCQAYARQCGLPPLIISVDQEGGTVARLKDGFTRFKGNPHIHTVEEARHFAGTAAKELKAVGINMNLAPVLDIVPSGMASVMKDRAFKGDEKTVSKLGLEVIQTLQSQGIMAVAKHFPGIGRTVLDSHFHLPTLDLPLDILEQSDLIPFADAIGAEVSGVLLSHIFYSRLDTDWQASLSPVIADDLLRGKLGYNGIVITDDLDMKAIGHDMETCIRQILKSRIDMALICHKGPNIDIAADTVQRLLKEDPALYEAGRQSYKRIIGVKTTYLNFP